MPKSGSRTGKPKLSGEPVSLKKLAEHLGLNPATVSVVLNNVPGRSIPQATRDRIKAAADELGYQPNLLARSLRSRKTHTIGVLVPELAEDYHTQIMSGIGDYLVSKGYFYFTVHHRHREDLVEEYCNMLVSRGAEGLIAIDTLLERKLSVPVVAVAGHSRVEGITNLVLDHDHAAQLALSHLYELGHRQVAFVRGHPFSSDTADRWRSTVKTAQKLGIAIKAELIIQLERDSITPDLVYPAVQQLLARKERFTALVSFNDTAAIGAIHALQDAGLRVPTDVSVIGFDDIRAAAFISPSLTTVRQPLREMGWMAAEYLLARLQSAEKFREQIVIHPELTVRDSTAAVAHGNESQDSQRKTNRESRDKDASLGNRTAAIGKE